MANNSFAENFVHSKVIDGGRKVWELPLASGAPGWTAIFLDAELYIERVEVAGVLARLQAEGKIPSMRSIFVSNKDAKSRHIDYVCNPNYADFLSRDILGWMAARYPQMDPKRVILIGLSLSGLAAAHAAITRQGYYRTVICQSPSAWWNDEFIVQEVPRADDSASSFWISVGNLETEEDISHPPSGMLQKTNQIDACRRTSDALISNGHNVHYRVFEGGHDPECWAKDLELALAWATRES